MDLLLVSPSLALASECSMFGAARCSNSSAMHIYFYDCRYDEQDHHTRASIYQRDQHSQKFTCTHIQL
jgi:hypothetical protein